MTPSRLLAVPTLAAALLLTAPSAALARDPLACFDGGAVDIGDLTIDPPEVCVL